jgi:hypothetical protein
MLLLLRPSSAESVGQVERGDDLPAQARDAREARRDLGAYALEQRAPSEGDGLGGHGRARHG